MSGCTLSSEFAPTRAIHCGRTDEIENDDNKANQTSEVHKGRHSDQTQLSHTIPGSQLCSRFPYYGSESV